MKCRSLLVTLAVLASLVTWAAASQRPGSTPRRPNLVFILADDLGWGDVGFNGRTEWKTPRLDRLASQGARFTRWYSASAVCGPSRAALLTGRYGIHNGVIGNGGDLPEEEVTLAEALQTRGYATGLYGKWHHGRTRPGKSSYTHPMDQGFESFFGFTNANEAHHHFPSRLWDGRQQVPVSGYADTLFTNRALEFLDQHQTEPFFLTLSYTAPHFGIEAPAEDVAEHRGKFPEANPSEPVNATYAAMITRLDKEVGRVLDHLEELGLAENTLVLFTSDHGATFEQGAKGAPAFHDSNRPFRGQKRTLLEGGIRVPAALRWPGQVPARSVVEEPLHMVDVMPSLLAAAGVAPQPEWALDGLNVLPVWTGRAKAPERTLYWEWRAEGSYQLAAMRGDMKLIFPARGAPASLYNVVKDPGERIDLRELEPETKKQLQRAVLQWLQTESPAAKQDLMPPVPKNAPKLTPIIPGGSPSGVPPI
ncbi:MAG: sulfatase-like hydrolase/transferase [Armatimonadota bacterium]